MHGAHEHIREVLDVVAGAPSARDHWVLASWQRCVTQHGLDPAHLQEAYIVPDTRLHEHRERLDALIHTARFGLEGLYRQVMGQGYVVLLSDDRGVTVDHIGDRSHTAALQRAGLTLGAEWSESRAGTCAVGSCIASGEPVIIHQTDHFDATHTPLTCTAAPIYDARGALAAVLDISALRSPESKHSQALALQLVRGTVLRIELAHLLAGFRSEWIVRLSRSHVFVDVDPEAAVALDADGRVLGMTQAGRKLLARALGEDWRCTNLLGRSLTDALLIELDELPRFTRTWPAHERCVQLRNGETVFLNVSAPEPRLAPTRSAHTMAAHSVSVPSPSDSQIPEPLRTLSGGDLRMQRLLETAGKLADKSIAILLHGETGCGKERLARAIHASRCTRGPFIAVNCAALPEQLIESELFGYVPGAFTGARAKGHKGLVREADGGTLFLDEIGDMPGPLQARLLRVLSEHEVMPVGASAPVPVRVRVIAASHRDLRTLVSAGAFREDLFYRLSSAVLHIPALRERSDLPWLIDALLQPHADTQPARISREARVVLERYHWPGNVRQLANALEFARAVCEGGVIQHWDLPTLEPTAPAFADAVPMLPAFSKAQMDREQPAPSERIPLTPEPSAPAGASDNTRLAQLLSEHGWNVSAIARRLGVDRTTIHRRMRRLGLVPPNRRSMRNT